jgi:hypothetical protein
MIAYLAHKFEEKKHVIKTSKEILSIVGGTLTMSNISGAISEMPRHRPLASSTKKIKNKKDINFYAM